MPAPPKPGVAAQPPATTLDRPEMVPLFLQHRLENRREAVIAAPRHLGAELRIPPHALALHLHGETDHVAEGPGPGLGLLVQSGHWKISLDCWRGMTIAQRIRQAL